MGRSLQLRERKERMVQDSPVKPSDTQRHVAVAAVYAGTVSFAGALVLLNLFMLDLGPFTVSGASAEEAPFSVRSLGWNVGLFALFGVQHSVMARASFKEAMRALFGDWYVMLERQIFVLASAFFQTLALLLWEPMGTVVLDLSILWVPFLVLTALGNILFVASLVGMKDADILGLHRVNSFRSADEIPVPFPVKFASPAVYQLCRHPMYLGFLLIIFFHSPVLTAGRLTLQACLTLYIMTGVQFEERGLLREFSNYKAYSGKTPMLFPTVSSIKACFQSMFSSSSSSTAAGAPKKE